MEFYIVIGDEPNGKNIVSIPNGMEFYGYTEILHLYKYAVSIPNGMEFYKKILFRAYAKKGVSIPNGMEFYSTNFAIFLGRKC